MIGYILVLFTVLTVYFLYKWVLLPKKQMDNYAKLFRNKNYKVAEMPFRPHTIPFYEELVSDGIQKKDPYFKHKRDYA